MKPTRICEGPNCNRPVQAKGLCVTHYWQRSVGKSLTPIPRRELAACLIEGCDRTDVRAKGLCTLHYSRLRATGDAGEAAPRAYSDPEEAFEARTAIEGDCLVWTGSREAAGYGSIWVNGKARKAHRYAWERERGPIPQGMVIDHICWNRPCVKIEHLRVVTQMKNTWNLNGAKSNSRSGVRNVWETPDGYHVQVTCNGVVHTSFHKTIEAATAAAEKLRTELFGEHAGR